MECKPFSLSDMLCDLSQVADPLCSSLPCMQDRAVFYLLHNTMGRCHGSLAADTLKPKHKGQVSGPTESLTFQLMVVSHLKRNQAVQVQECGNMRHCCTTIRFRVRETARELFCQHQEMQHSQGPEKSELLCIKPQVPT